MSKLSTKLKNRRKEITNDIKDIQNNKRENLERQKDIVDKRMDTINNLDKRREERRGDGISLKNVLPISPSLPQLSFCPMMNQQKDDDKRPFGYEPGTIRASLAIFIVLNTCILMQYAIFSNMFMLQQRFQLLMAWLVIASGVISFYFLSRRRMLRFF